ncbi:Olfactory Receptor 14J1 [Manis pentadactyla]|nr:Olfactory Receptor 14J1 [Manis pentadactyla]
MQTMQGVLFLIAYLAALLGNGFIILLITWDPQHHIPMYFFLKNLSLIDLCYISVTVPKFVLNSLMNRNTISFLGCVFQVLFFAGFGSGELVILTVMSYDHYVAICCPLHYDSIMNKGACGWMVVASYISVGVYGAMHMAATFSTTFTSNKIYHFFCDIPQIILISDSKMNINEAPMTSFGACALAYLKPASELKSIVDIVLSIFYTVVPPLANPILYSLRNKDIKDANPAGCLFLIAYLAALSRNSLIIILITWDPQLHTPMYFFLKNLSLIDLCYIFVTVPKFALNSLMNRNKISFLGCIFQVLFFASFCSAEFAILTVMSSDHYVAICLPLHYETIMTKEACGWMVVASYITVGVYTAMHTALTFSTTFSSNKIHHFFCDIPQIILISETKMNINEVSITAFSASIALVCFISILYSYVHIFSAVFRMSSREARSKALSTFFPHVMVVTVSYNRCRGLPEASL